MAADVMGEFDFWGDQATEHALFLHLGLEDPALKAEALRLHENMKAAYEGKQLDHFMFLLDRSLAFKKMLSARLAAGEWLGWLFPLFIDHVAREEEYFKAKIANVPIPPAVETTTWLQFMGEHAHLAAHLVDPTEQAAMMKALQLSGQIGQLHDACRVSCGPQMIALSERKGRELDAFFSGMKAPLQPKSIIHPVLAAHVVREGRRFVQTMQGLLMRERASSIRQPARI